MKGPQMTSTLLGLQNKPKYPVPALEKALDILEYLSEVTVPQSQAELARALGLSINKLFRMLSCLEERGYILRDEHSNKYSLSLRLYELAHTHSPVDQFLQAARQPMRDFVNIMRESVHLSIVRGHSQLILAQEESPEQVRISISVGSKLPALKTASGCLLIAHMDDETRARFLAEDELYQKMTSEKRTELEQTLRQASIDHYIVADSDVKLGVRDVTVLVGNSKLDLTAALATPVLLSVGQEVDTEAILMALRARAEAITLKLGLSHD
jgi:DNA-binding IclR family transcriptional regulator